jgi:hypothetical protein
MMRRIIGILFILAIVPVAALAEITAEQVAGKTLTFKKSVFVIGADGSLTGKTDRGEAVTGTWQVKGGKWCRTITEPARLAGSACQTASIKGKTLTITREDGTAVAWKMR